MASRPQGGLAALLGALRGTPVSVLLADGARAEGVVSVCGADVVLRAVRVVAPDGRAETRDVLAVPLGRLAALQTLGAADLGAAPAAGGFATDAEISAGSSGAGRALQPWADASGDGALESPLEDACAGGAWDQFGANARLFGVTPRFDEAQYTTALDRGAPGYARRAAEAARLAAEIERSSPARSAHAADERGLSVAGMDEEDLYGAVVRPSSAASSAPVGVPANAPVLAASSVAASAAVGAPGIAGSSSPVIAGSSAPVNAPSSAPANPPASPASVSRTPGVSYRMAALSSVSPGARSPAPSSDSSAGSAGAGAGGQADAVPAERRAAHVDGKAAHGDGKASNGERKSSAHTERKGSVHAERKGSGHGAQARADGAEGERLRAGHTYHRKTSEARAGGSADTSAAPAEAARPSSEAKPKAADQPAEKPAEKAQNAEAAEHAAAQPAPPQKRTLNPNAAAFTPAFAAAPQPFYPAAFDAYAGAYAAPYYPPSAYYVPAPAPGAPPAAHFDGAYYVPYYAGGHGYRPHGAQRPPHGDASPRQ